MAARFDLPPCLEMVRSGADGRDAEHIHHKIKTVDMSWCPWSDKIRPGGP